MKKRSGKKSESGKALRTRFFQQEAVALHTARAVSNMQAGRMEDAEREARQALRIERGSHDATIVLCSILAASRRERETLTLVHEALEKRPKNPALLYHLAGCAFNVGRLEEARRALAKLTDVMQQRPELLRGRRRRLRQHARDLQRMIEARVGRGSGGAAGSASSQPSLFDISAESAAQAATTALRPAASVTPATEPEPGSRVSPQPSIPRVQHPPSPRPLAVLVDVADERKLAAAEAPWKDDPWSDDLQDRELVLEAQRIRLLAQYEDLLCLPTLVGVAKLDYQVETVRKILRRQNGRALLCDEVGLGKTIEAGMVIKEYLLRGLARSVLVLTPSGLVRQWREEMGQKFGLDFTAWGGRTKCSPRANDEPLLAIGSIALARHPRNVAAFSEKEWDLVVVDEAHHLRRRSSRSWALVNSLRKRFLLLLTATPVHNNLTELFELVTLVRPGLLGTPAEFRRKFLDGPGGRARREPQQLREALAEVMVRNTRSHAGVALPKRFATTLVLEPRPDEAAAYRAAGEYAALRYPGADPSVRMGLRHLLASAGSGPQAVGEAAARRLAGESPPIETDGGRRLLEQIVEVTHRTEGSAKAERLLELAASTDEQMVVFCRYRATVDELSARLAGRGIEHAVYHGALPRAEKDRAIEAFREGARVLLSTESGGEGRNIQFCRTIVNYDLPWDPMQIEQRIGRVHRIGQQRDVFVFNLVLAGTLEEELLRILEEKIHLFELIVGEVDSILGHLERREEFADILLGLWAGSGDEAERRRRFDDFGKELAQARAEYEKKRAIEESLFQDHLEA